MGDLYQSSVDPLTLLDGADFDVGLLTTINYPVILTETRS